MIIDCPNAQYISRNIKEIADVIIRFKELDSVYSGNLSLYMDSDTWEIFDIRRSIVLIRHSFKHVRQLSIDIRRFTLDFTNLSSANLRVAYGRNLTTSEVSSIKHLYRVYGMDSYLFTNKTIKKYIYDRIEKTKNMADCY